MNMKFCANEMLLKDSYFSSKKMMNGSQVQVCRYPGGITLITRLVQLSPFQIKHNIYIILKFHNYLTFKKIQVNNQCAIFKSKDKEAEFILELTIIGDTHSFFLLAAQALASDIKAPGERVKHILKVLTLFIY